jgi:hypothetical protein
MLRRTPTLHNNVVVLIHALHDSHLRHRLLEAFASMICTDKTNDSQLYNAFPLLYTIATDPHCAPTVRILFSGFLLSSSIFVASYNDNDHENGLLIHCFVCSYIFLYMTTVILLFFFSISHLFKRY